MFTFLTFLAVPLLASAQLVPTAPGPGDVFKQGAQCTIQWNADGSGQWKQTNIELMTGPNQQMVHLATVATVDGTDPTKTSISVPCLAVSPNAPIYFYQFTAQGQNATWTGRFAISDLSGATTAPTNAKQPNGEAIPWGTGKLLDATKGSPPPSTAPAGQIDGSGGDAGSAPVSASVNSSSASVGVSSNPLPSSSAAPSFVAIPSSSSTSSTPSSVVTIVSQPLPASSGGAAAATPSGGTTTQDNDNGASLYGPSAAAVLAAMLILATAGLC